MIPVIKNNDNPVLFEKLIAELNQSLLAKLDWLDNVFGRAHMIVKKTDVGAEYKEPAIYINDSEYLSVLPNQEFGNFSFVLLSDSQEYDTAIKYATHQGKGLLTCNASIIFWFDLTTIYAEDVVTVSHIDNIKLELIKHLTTSGFLTSGRIELKSIDERHDNVYKEYSIKNVDAQFMTFPYYALRFNCKFKVHELC